MPTPAVNNEIQWLVHLGVQRGILSFDNCLSVARSIPADAELLDYSKALLKTSPAPDINILQDLINEAWNKAQDGPVPHNPFAVEQPEAAAPDPAGPAQDSPPAGMPDFSTTGSLGEEAAGAFLRDLLLECQRQGFSDLHLSAGARPFVRAHREVRYLSQTVLSAEASDRLNTALLTDLQDKEYREDADLDFALVLDKRHRFRVNLMRHKEGAAGTYRIIPEKVRSLEDLGFGDADRLRKLLAHHNGLILLTGPVGSGKTLTLASMIDELNRTRQDHLITVEAPIEIVQRSELCQITQREVGSHTRSFKTALKGALRQDPDIIVIGEMRDLETIEIAISASETGHLVIGTLHTQDAANTLNRVLDVFPSAQQTQIRAMVSESLRGIVCQRLLPATDGGLVLAYELLLNNTAVANLIRENKPEGLVNVMETGSAEGMRLMDRSVLELQQQGRIDRATALANIKNKMIAAGIS